MKIVAILPFKNESWILPVYIKNVLPLVDTIIAIDDNSTDDSKQILKSASDKIKIYSNNDFPKSGWAEYSIRNKLLNLAREEKATHIIALDADETFSSNFIPFARKILEKLEPGQKLQMQWIALWKTQDHYREDNSVWSNNFKDFIVCDSGNLTHDNPGNSIGVGRTPGKNNEETLVKLNPKYGVVLHYQFSQWRNFQLKQAWYRMSELLMQGKSNTNSINQKYSITLDDPNAHVKACPEEWINGIDYVNLNEIPISWHFAKIKEWIQEYGPEYFKDLNIWHIKEIKELLNS